MCISVLDIFAISIGPSSSHTSGPMRAARKFVTQLDTMQLLPKVKRVTVDLYGSLALTGAGHKTDQAIFIGLEGDWPETVATAGVAARITAITTKNRLKLLAIKEIDFNPDQDVMWHYKEVLPYHTNGLKLTAYDAADQILISKTYYSIGGGFIVTEGEPSLEQQRSAAAKIPFPFTTAQELWQIARDNNLRIDEVILANEATWLPKEEVQKRLVVIAAIMENSIRTGCTASGILPGALKLARRVPALYQKLLKSEFKRSDHTLVMQWVNTYALAVAEENAAGGRVVTAPTNGASGVIPAVLQYYKEFCDVKPSPDDMVKFLLTAGAIAMLYKMKASISGAEVGCQGEIGVACSMAAGALTAVLGGSLDQIEKAAEIAMEHNLGLTCDPVAGLVQIPCIERNAMAAVKAINAAHLTLWEGGDHRVSLDQIIATMLQTGKDMRSRYKETALGGLAVNVTVC